MNKAELVDAMASSAGISKADSGRALEGFLMLLKALSLKAIAYL